MDETGPGEAPVASAEARAGLDPGRLLRCMLWGAVVGGLGSLLYVLPWWLGLDWSHRTFDYAHTAERAVLPVVLAGGAIKMLFDAVYVGAMACAGMVAGLCAAWGRDPVERAMAGLAPGLLLGGAGLALRALDLPLYRLIGPPLGSILILLLAGGVAAATAAWRPAVPGRIAAPPRKWR